MPPQIRVIYLYRGDFGFGCLWSFWTYNTSVGFGCCGLEPSGLQCGTVWSSWWCCSSKAGCFLRCGHSRRWFLLGIGAAMMTGPAALTPTGRFHWEGGTGGGERKSGPGREGRELTGAGGDGVSRGKRRERREADKLNLFHRFWCLNQGYVKIIFFLSYYYKYKYPYPNSLFKRNKINDYLTPTKTEINKQQKCKYWHWVSNRWKGCLSQDETGQFAMSFCISSRCRRYPWASVEDVVGNKWVALMLTGLYKMIHDRGREVQYTWLSSRRPQFVPHVNTKVPDLSLNLSRKFFCPNLTGELFHVHHVLKRRLSLCLARYVLVFCHIDYYRRTSVERTAVWNPSASVSDGWNSWRIET